MALTATEEAQLRELIDQQAAILSLASSESTIISKLGATKVTLADLSSASTIDDADLFLIRQGTTEKSVTGALIKEAGTQPDASTTVKGIVELATDAETQTGTDTVRAVTPSTLSSRTATESRTGIVELATDAEAQAFTANKFIDGAKLASALQGANQSLAASGYQKLPGGLIMQWGRFTTSAATNQAVTFPLAFPTAVYSVTACNSGGGSNFTVSAYTPTTTGFLTKTQNAASGEMSAGQIDWVAFGK